MEKIDILSKCDSFFFIGVGGISMSALAKYLLSLGKRVSGSDRTANEQTKILSNLGARICLGHYAKNLKGEKVVVYTSAIGENNPELISAKKKGLTILKRSQLLSLILNNYKSAVCVSGSHGKTTCSAMLATVLEIAKKSPTCFIGGVDAKLTNFKMGSGEYAVCEACEYKRNFLGLNSKYKIVLNIDNDHLDSFGSVENMISDFNLFVKDSIGVLNADDINSSTLAPSEKITFGITEKADFTAKCLKQGKKGYSFKVYHGKEYLGRIKLKVFGKHNIYNALAVICVCAKMGVRFKDIKRGLGAFRSVARRNEYLGKFKKIKIYADYAHHPTELKATLSALKINGKTDLVIFQPHTYSRTKLLMEDFVSALKEYERVVLYKTYPAREVYDYFGSEKKLCLNLAKNSNYPPTLVMNETELFALLSKEKGVKRAFVLGAGDLYDTVKKTITEKN